MGTVKDPPKKQEQEREKIFLGSGVELTPELEEELAAEAERGYDLSKARRRYLAQPVLADEESLSVLTFARSEREFEEVRQRAESEGRPFDEVAREVLSEDTIP